MRDLINKFCDCFPDISFDITKEKIKLNLSVESVSTGEREIQKMLTDASRQLSKFKKLHKQGKVSAEEVFDCEWRVNELEEELRKFKRDVSSDNIDDFEDLI